MIRGCSILFLASLLISGGCQINTIAQENRLIMNTVVNIKIPQSNQKETRSALAKSFCKMEEVEKLMNRYDKNSEISFINRLKSGQEIKISPQIVLVIKKALELNRITEGAFDVTISPLVDLWDFYKEKNIVPPEEEIMGILSKVDSRNILLNDNGTISFLQDGVKLDLSGIAKGYAVDAAIKVLRENGIENSLVDAGGDIYCLGSGPDKNGWQIGIRHPRKEALLGRLVLKDRAVATSGDYQKFFLVDKKRYSHILDPRSGYPISDTPMSVTVVAPDCITADGLATAILVLGPIDGLRLVEGLDRVEAVVVSKGEKDLKIDVTSGLKDLYESL